MPRRSPLTAIFDPVISYGSVNTGSMLGIIHPQRVSLGTAAETDTAGAFGVVLSPATPIVIRDTHPAVYLRMTETSGSTAFDTSGHGRNGSYIGSPSLASVAAPDGANYPTFDGVDDEVHIPDDNAFSVDNSGTGMSWLAIFKCTSTFSGGFIIIGKSDNTFTNAEWEMDFFGNDGKFQFSTQRPNTAFIKLGVTTQPTSTSLWRVAVVTMASPTASPVFYFNGTTPSVSVSGAGGAFYTNGTSIVSVGNDANSLGPFVGCLAQIAIFPTELTPTEVAAIMSAAHADGWF